ncbi:MAG: DUF1707 domain-containing protein [Gemmatimonadota bacterium]|nr:DUF1707 domain-containing protein [Gemmatimonadota bacterium]
MSDGQDAGRLPSEETRQVTIDALMEHFANDVLDVEEFERRVDIAHAAKNADELKELLRDLPGGSNVPATRDVDSSTGVAHTREYSVTSGAHREEKGYVVAMLGGSSRKGRWTPAHKTVAVAVMGGIELDFREAVFAPGVTEVQVFSVWGGVDIVVPPGLNVESRGIALLGGFDHAGDTVGMSDPSQPTLRITGFVCMAGVDVSVRHPGESARDARRRRRVERREQRKRLRSG